MKQVGRDPADDKKWGGTCSAVCIEIVPNVVRAIQGGLHSLLHPPALAFAQSLYTIPCLKLFVCQWCVRPSIYTSTAVYHVSEQFRVAAILLLLL